MLLVLHAVHAHGAHGQLPLQYALLGCMHSIIGWIACIGMPLKDAPYKDRLMYTTSVSLPWIHPSPHAVMAGRRHILHTAIPSTNRAGYG